MSAVPTGSILKVTDYISEVTGTFADVTECNAEGTDGNAEVTDSSADPTGSRAEESHSGAEPPGCIREVTRCGPEGTHCFADATALHGENKELLRAGSTLGRGTGQFVVLPDGAVRETVYSSLGVKYGVTEGAFGMAAASLSRRTPMATEDCPIPPLFAPSRGSGGVAPV
jgi:hypothetical protein